MKKHIEVVAAVILKDNKIFCAQRHDGGELAKKWEFPGGKVENGETLQESLKRELFEELKIDVNVQGFITTVHHEYKTFNLTLHAFYCEALTDKFILTEHLDSKWLKREELDQLDWAAADIPVVNIVKES